ncbi:MAG: hypothetical protein EBY32_16775 [Proteobacteria bacterium]|nr:hypothetical protein [Pseudomonadota bacterium]
MRRERLHTPRKMTEAARGALRQALAVALAALVVGIFHIPQPFLAVLLVQLLGGIPCQSALELFRRILSAFVGCLAGVVILTLAPNEQWISLPLFFTLTGWGTVFALRRFGPACGILFGIGIVAMFAESFVFPARDIVFGFAHLFSLITATLAAALVGLAFFREPMGAKNQSPPLGAAVVIGAAAVSGLIAACTLLPVQLNVTTISSLTTALALTMTGGGVAKKILGGLLGIVVALVFLIPINGSGNDLAVFLLGLSAVVFRQAAAMFAVAATMLPQPDRFITDSMERMYAGFLGLCIGSACFLLHSLATRSPAERMQKA